MRPSLTVRSGSSDDGALDDDADDDDDATCGRERWRGAACVTGAATTGDDAPTASRRGRAAIAGGLATGAGAGAGIESGVATGCCTVAAGGRSGGQRLARRRVADDERDDERDEPEGGGAAGVPDETRRAGQLAPSATPASAARRTAAAARPAAASRTATAAATASAPAAAPRRGVADPAAASWPARAGSRSAAVESPISAGRVVVGARAPAATASLRCDPARRAPPAAAAPAAAAACAPPPASAVAGLRDTSGGGGSGSGSESTAGSAGSAPIGRDLVAIGVHRASRSGRSACRADTRARLGFGVDAPPARRWRGATVPHSPQSAPGSTCLPQTSHTTIQSLANSSATNAASAAARPAERVERLERLGQLARPRRSARRGSRASAFLTMASSARGTSAIVDRRRDHLRRRHALQRLELRRRREQALAGQQLVQDDAGGEHVDAPIDRLMVHLLGRHIRVLALERLRDVVVELADDLGDAEVEQLDRAVAADHDVRRRHVAMDDLAALAVAVDELVRVAEAVAHVARDGQRAADRHALRRAPRRRRAAATGCARAGTPSPGRGCRRRRRSRGPARCWDARAAPSGAPRCENMATNSRCAVSAGSIALTTTVLVEAARAVARRLVDDRHAALAHAFGEQVGAELNRRRRWRLLRRACPPLP